jgi:hypothetical protein
MKMPRHIALQRKIASARLSHHQSGLLFPTSLLQNNHRSHPPIHHNLIAMAAVSRNFSSRDIGAIFG